MSEQIHTLEQAEQYAAAHGIAISPADRAKIAAAQRAELERLKSLEEVQGSAGGISRLVGDFNRFYPKFLESLLALGDTLLTLAQTLIVAFGIPATLVLLLIVEHQRVYHGIALFEIDPALASFAAAALVILNLVLEFQIHYVENRSGYTPDRDSRWSLRTWLKNAGYTLGLGATWKPRLLSPAARYRKLLGLVTFTILALALAGSMRSVISQQSGAWHIAIVDVVENSTLSEMLTWAGGLLFAAAAVLSAQGLSRYVALRCAEIVVSMRKSDTPTVQYQQELDQVGASVVMAVVNAKLQKQQAAPVVVQPVHQVQPENPTLRPVPTATMLTSVGNGHANGNGHGV